MARGAISGPMKLCLSASMAAKGSKAKSSVSLHVHLPHVSQRGGGTPAPSPLDLFPAVWGIRCAPEQERSQPLQGGLLQPVQAEFQVNEVKQRAQATGALGRPTQARYHFSTGASRSLARRTYSW